MILCNITNKTGIRNIDFCQDVKSSFQTTGFLLNNSWVIALSAIALGFNVFGCSFLNNHLLDNCYRGYRYYQKSDDDVFIQTYTCLLPYDNHFIDESFIENRSTRALLKNAPYGLCSLLYLASVQISSIGSTCSFNLAGILQVSVMSHHCQHRQSDFKAC